MRKGGVHPETPPLLLSLVVTGNPDGTPPLPLQYRLHVGNAVVWLVPPEVGERLDTWFHLQAGKLHGDE